MIICIYGVIFFLCHWSGEQHYIYLWGFAFLCAVKFLNMWFYNIRKCKFLHSCFVNAVVTFLLIVRCFDSFAIYLTIHYLLSIMYRFWIIIGVSCKFAIAFVFIQVMFSFFMIKFFIFVLLFYLCWLYFYFFKIIKWIQNFGLLQITMF